MTSENNSGDRVPECWAALLVRGDFEPSDLTASVGFTPHAAHKKGELNNSGKRRFAVEYKQTLWMVRGQKKQTWDGEDGLRELRGIVEPFQERLMDYVRANSLSIEVQIQGYIFGSSVPSIGLNIDDLDWLRSLHAVFAADLIVSA